eukprot:COSAG04_NODE_534_length_12949_cov_5.651673_17_plen_265_part_00
MFSLGCVLLTNHLRCSDAERHATYETNGWRTPSHPGIHPPAWWQVDLGGMAQISRVDVWHRTGCGEPNRVDLFTGGISEQSTCNARLEGAHVYVSNTNRNPTTKHMWSLTECQNNPQACTVCGVIHMAAAAQPETIECPQGTAGRFGTVGRFVAIAHTWPGEMSIGHNGQQYGGGGSSGGSVITICEAKVFGTRMASHEYNNPQGSCTVYNGQMGGPVQAPPPPPPPPPPRTASRATASARRRRPLHHHHRRRRLLRWLSLRQR